MDSYGEQQSDCCVSHGHSGTHRGGSVQQGRLADATIFDPKLAQALGAMLRVKRTRGTAQETRANLVGIERPHMSKIKHGRNLSLP